MQDCHSIAILLQQVNLWDVSEQELDDFDSFGLDRIHNIVVTVCTDLGCNHFLFWDLADVSWLKWVLFVNHGCRLSVAHQRLVELGGHLANLV